MAVVLEDGTVVKIPPLTPAQKASLDSIECPCDRDKKVDPICCAAGMCAREIKADE